MITQLDYFLCVSRGGFFKLVCGSSIVGGLPSKCRIYRRLLVKLRRVLFFNVKRKFSLRAISNCGFFYGSTIEILYILPS